MIDPIDKITAEDIREQVNELLKMSGKKMATLYLSVCTAIYVMAIRNKADPLLYLDEAYRIAREKLIKHYKRIDPLSTKEENNPAN